MRTRLEWVCLGSADSMWILDSMQERFHNMSPTDFESMFIKPGDSQTKGLRYRKEVSSGRVVLAH